MEEPGTSSDDTVCKFCNSSPWQYVCPKCHAPYCSLQCYKSSAHSECSESFYKEWVETELKMQEPDPRMRQEMIDILKRTQLDQAELDYDFCGEDADEDGEEIHSVDSDDEQDIPDLEERLKNVDLDDADQLWSVLTDCEKQEFEAKLRNGDTSNFLPKWVPWWSHDTKILIKEIDETDAEPDYVARCPKLVDVPILSDLTKASPSVRYNLLNVLYSYVYTLFYCNGDHLSTPRESVSIFLRLSDNMFQNKIYNASSDAIDSVLERIKNSQDLSANAEATIATREAVDLIINGPEMSNPNFYVTAALSDLHRMFEAAKSEYTHKKTLGDRAFTKKFVDNEVDVKISKKSILLCIKKIEYYLSWVKNGGKLND